MKSGRLETLARIIIIMFSISTLAYSAATTRLPERLFAIEHNPHATASRPVFIEGIVSLGGFAVNVAFASDGKPVCISVGMKDEG